MNGGKIHYASVGMWEEAYLLNLVSPELALDGAGLRPQEHQRSALCMDITSIFSLSVSIHSSASKFGQAPR